MIEMWLNPENTDQIAVKTGPNVTAGDYFVYHVEHGGGYTDGLSEGVPTWTPIPLPADQE